MSKSFHPIPKIQRLFLSLYVRIFMLTVWIDRHILRKIEFPLWHSTHEKRHLKCKRSISWSWLFHFPLIMTPQWRSSPPFHRTHFLSKHHKISYFLSLYILFICNCKFFPCKVLTYVCTVATVDDDPINIHNSVPPLVLGNYERNQAKSIICFSERFKRFLVSMLMSLVFLHYSHSNPFTRSFYLFFGMIYGTFQADHLHRYRHHHSHDDGPRCCGCCFCSTTTSSTTIIISLAIM